MKIVLAPDSFKGSLTATEVCQAMETGARQVFPDAEIISIPLADGGEGTLDALITGTGATLKTTVVRGPMGQPVEARWAITPQGQAIIEMAQASGLHLVPKGNFDALAASSYGTGQLVKAALDAGCREIILGIGGSATTDGGIGALSALGLRARDVRQRALTPGGGSLSELAELDLQFLDVRLQKTSFTVLCDVTNPLHGPNGAAHVYAAQKGASPEQIGLLDTGLKRLADVAEETATRGSRDSPGAGAAGGIGYGLLTFCHAELRSGIDVVLEVSQFGSKIANADLILTGEGSLDAQTLNGKTVAGICRVAKGQPVPVIAFGGSVTLSAEDMDALHLLSAFTLVDGPRKLDYCINHATALVTASVIKVLRLRT